MSILTLHFTQMFPHRYTLIIRKFVCRVYSRGEGVLPCGVGYCGVRGHKVCGFELVWSEKGIDLDDFGLKLVMFSLWLGIG